MRETSTALPSLSAGMSEGTRATRLLRQIHFAQKRLVPEVAREVLETIVGPEKRQRTAALLVCQI